MSQTIIRDEAIEFLCDVFEEIGEFDAIEPQRSFPRLSELNAERKRHIWLRKKKDCMPDGQRDYLIIVNSQPYKRKNFVGKLLYAGECGIAPFPLFCKPVKGKPSYFFMWDNAIFKESRRHHSLADRKGQIRTRQIERKIFDALGFVWYFKPTARPRLQRITFEDRDSLYEYISLEERCFPIERDLVQAKKNIVQKELYIFSLKAARTREGNLVALPSEITVGQYTTLDSLLSLEKRDPRCADNEILGERIAISLDGCSDKELVRLAKKFGKDALGAYAPPDVDKIRVSLFQ